MEANVNNYLLEQRILNFAIFFGGKIRHSKIPFKHSTGRRVELFGKKQKTEEFSNFISLYHYHHTASSL
jgi:hypothetical protein